MYEFSKDNIHSYVCGLYLYIFTWIIKVGRLSTLIFGRLHVYICMWILKIGRLNTLIFGETTLSVPEVFPMSIIGLSSFK